MLLSALLFLATTAVAAPTNSHVLHEKRGFSDAVRRGKVDPEAIIPIRLALTQSNLDSGYDHLMSVSHPESSKYGRHWTVEEIHETFAPSEETVSAVKSWLEQVGVARHRLAESASRGWLGFDLTAAEAESLFGTKYYEFEDRKGNIRIGSDEYHVPSHLSTHIDYMTPGVMLSPPVARRNIKRDVPVPEKSSKTKAPVAPEILNPLTNTTHCGKYITPACIKALYSIPDAKFNQPENALGIYEEEDTYDQEDLNMFFSRYAPNVPNGTHPTLVSINNATAPVALKKGGGESIVDFDLAYSILYPQSITLYQTVPTKAQLEIYGEELAPFEALLAAIDGALCTEEEKKGGADCGTIELTRVVSNSYGTSELQMPEAATVRACNEYMKLGLKGHTIIFASGDYGPAGHPAELNPALQGKVPITNACINPDYMGYTEKEVAKSYFHNGTVYNPQFPASCPFITSVGATRLEVGQTTAGPESPMFAIDDSLPGVFYFTSTGGTSNYFKTPEYQQSAVATYFDNHNPGYPTYVYNGTASVGANGGKYARGGRGVPDVSANGQHLVQFANGEYMVQAGTSLAAPIFASIITMINQERTAAGKGPVGFINPVLYANPGAFNDITIGNNPGCGTEGFHAASGWDPVTGLGTPNYPKLLEAFMGCA